MPAYPLSSQFVREAVRPKGRAKVDFLDLEQKGLFRRQNLLSAVRRPARAPARLIRLTTTRPCVRGAAFVGVAGVSDRRDSGTAPHGSGAHLHARRYALFTLVGIAGEDDLDAPDLGAGGTTDPNPGLDIQTSPKPGVDKCSFRTSDAGRKGKVIRPPRIVLATDQSKALRDRLVGELSNLKSADEAADWVHKNLPAKNTLTFADAEAVEAGFRERLVTIEGGRPGFAISEVVDNSGAERLQEQSQTLGGPETPAPPAIVILHRVAAKTIRLRDKEYCGFVASQPCVVCGRRPAEAHHIRFAQPRALGVCPSSRGIFGTNVIPFEA
jgi:hypothetical protein